MIFSKKAANALSPLEAMTAPLLTLEFNFDLREEFAKIHDIDQQKPSAYIEMRAAVAERRQLTPRFLNFNLPNGAIIQAPLSVAPVTPHRHARLDLASRIHLLACQFWIPAFAGMTLRRVGFITGHRKLNSYRTGGKKPLIAIETDPLATMGESFNGERCGLRHRLGTSLG